MVTTWRLAGFLGGVLLTAGVFTAPVAHLDHQSLTGHMVQHLVLMTVAAPLILLGLPDRLSAQLSQCTPKVVGWLAGTFCIILWHIPAVFALGRQSERWHEFELATFLAAGLLFWSPVLLARTSAKEQVRWSIPIYLFLATLPCDTLSAFLTFCGRVVYPVYDSGAGLSDHSALRDQEFAGTIMWVWVTFVYLVPAVIHTVQGLSGRPHLVRLAELEDICLNPRNPVR